MARYVEIKAKLSDVETCVKKAVKVVNGKYEIIRIVTIFIRPLIILSFILIIFTDNVLFIDMKLKKN